MKSILLSSVYLIAFIFIFCTRDTSEYLDKFPATNNKIPLNDLGKDFWRGKQGGLYPEGSNLRPANHNSEGIQIALQIQPLDREGNISPSAGHIVWLAVGMSNTTQEAEAFIQMAKSLPDRNPNLILVDGAQGGWDIDMINNPDASYWHNINNRLNTIGLTYKQVQVIWFKQADRIFPDTTFAGYTHNFKNKLKTSMKLLRLKYPNLKLCYISSRIYAGYQAGTGSNPEPYAYYTGWGVKSLIEEQINGSADLAYGGNNSLVPWLSWGPYLWANGPAPRSDGLHWLFPDDFQADGIHPSNRGRQKVAQKLIDFFRTDETAVIWFLK